MDFNADIYQASLLRSLFDPSQIAIPLYQHWLEYGLDHGLFASSIQQRSDLIALIDYSKHNVLEIGPFYQPVFPGESQNVFFADVLDVSQLRARAVSLGIDPARVPHISFTYKDGLIDANGMLFRYLFSSHCVEHQPDLIGHILNVIDLLASDGQYFFIVPDHRMCFDRYMQPSLLPEVIAAYYEKRVKPTLKSVIEHRVFTIDYSNPWFPNTFSSLVPHAKTSLDSALTEYATSEYVDVHCWYFTPSSLKVLLDNLRQLELLPATAEFSVFPMGQEIGCIISRQT